MATVSSYESLRHPSRSDMRQFAELFAELYHASSDEARRQAVAALSRSPNVPETTALFIASRPIAIAAIFLTGSKALSDGMLIHILKDAGPDHARAIGKRENLSSKVIEALVESHQDHKSRRSAAPPEPHAAEAAERRAREERLREEIKALARAALPQPSAPERLESASGTHQALFVRFARAGDAGMLSVVLADALSSSQWLSERILLDISGRQLAETLAALAVEPADAAYVLKRIYPHLARDQGAETLLSGLDRAEAAARVESWQRADRYTNGGERPEPANAATAEIARITPRRRAG
ncbi:MAG: DUF2336 domain-containing protein [Shinella sp.]|nr:DUF2336 domain-containing protein [Shinella sp.]